MQNLREQFDKENLYDIIKNIPAQLTNSFRDTKVAFAQKPEKIVFCGMGGSASPANLLKNYLAVAKVNFNIPIKIVRSYNLPTTVDSSWSGFFSSYSGNTEETLATFASAQERNLKELILLAHDGKLKNLAQENNLPLVQIPNFAQPRMGYLYVVGALLKILKNSHLISVDYDSMAEDVQALLNTPKPEEIGKKLASSLQGYVPIIYSSVTWESLAMVWKINLNENSKIPSFWNSFPELNHNEMVGYTNLLGNFKTIILKDPEDDARFNKRIDVFEKIFAEKLKVEVLEMPNGSPLYKMIYTLLIGLWTSYYLALMNNIDPAPVAVVEEFKRLLND